MQQLGCTYCKHLMHEKCFHTQTSVPVASGYIVILLWPKLITIKFLMQVYIILFYVYLNAVFWVTLKSIQLIGICYIKCINYCNALFRPSLL